MKNKLKIYRGACAIFLGIFISVFFYFHFQANSAPLLANYFLNQLPTDINSLNLLAKNDLLIITPAQAFSHPAQLAYIRAHHPSIVVLAYVPSESYNTKYWNNDPIFKNFQVQNNWWLRNESGQVVEHWPTLAQLNMSAEFSNYLVNFCNQYVADVPNIDGIFFDMVSDGISWSGNVDLNGDGVADDKKSADTEWTQRVQYFLQQAKQNIHTKYLVINGSSNPKFQPYVNGRMFESFPASWDWSGNWATIMNYLARGKKDNAFPQMVIINSGTNNIGNQNDFKKMRFGLASSLMEDNVYYSFDYGENDHGQLWNYDEYDVNLGASVGSSHSVGGSQTYNNDVWLRNYENGLVLVNSTAENRTVDLGSDYEKIIGKQDPMVNDGSIVDKVELNSRDGIVLRKAVLNLFNTPFKNGSLVRFFDMRGNRTRNGFFAFVPGSAGGARVFVGDLNGDGSNEKIVGDTGRLEIFNPANLHWFDSYPFGGDNNKELRYSVGKSSNGEMKILVTPTVGNRGILYDYHGGVLKESFLPFGTKYNAGFFGALGNFDGGSDLEVAIGSGGVRVGEVLVFDADLQKIKYRFFPFDKKYLGRIKVAAGDINGDGKAEIIVMGKFGVKNVVRIFDSKGKKLSEWAISFPLGGGDLNIGVTDVNFDGKDEVVVEGG